MREQGGLTSEKACIFVLRRVKNFRPVVSGRWGRGRFFLDLDEVVKRVVQNVRVFDPNISVRPIVFVAIRFVHSFQDIESLCKFTKYCVLSVQEVDICP